MKVYHLDTFSLVIKTCYQSEKFAWRIGGRRGGYVVKEKCNNSPGLVIGN